MVRISRTRKKIVAAAVTAMAAATLGMASSGQASAAEPCGGPGSGLMCVYTDNDYQGAASQTATSSFSDLSGTGMNDAISSIANFTSRDMCFYADPNYQGDTLVIPAGFEASNVTNLPHFSMNDRISSYRPCPWASQSHTS
ncbi:peptidase inhibitor family I36 protein [Streptomyces sp. NPDC054765]